jgi:putative sigma-54 modulation protein
MKIQIQTEKIELSESQESYIVEKIESLKKYYDRITDEAVQVRVDVERNESLKQKQKIVLKVTMSVPKAMFRAEVNSFTVEEGTDIVHDKLLRQIERYKNKHLKIDHTTVADVAAELSTELPKVDEADVRISKRKLFSDLIPMSETEAIDTMKMLGHSFFVFVNSATDRYNVVYLRHDKESYGLVELEHQDGVTH